MHVYLLNAVTLIVTNNGYSLHYKYHYNIYYIVYASKIATLVYLSGCSVIPQ